MCAGVRLAGSVFASLARLTFDFDAGANTLALPAECILRALHVFARVCGTFAVLAKLSFWASFVIAVVGNALAPYASFVAGASDLSAEINAVPFLAGEIAFASDGLAGVVDAFTEVTGATLGAFYFCAWIALTATEVTNFA